jgi:transaldolase / glucose-6-phosphate isomerase
VFLEITAQPARDLAIPGRTSSFGVVEAAQAAGDFQVLTERGRRVLRAHLAPDADRGIAAIAEAARRALERRRHLPPRQRAAERR